MAHFDSVWHGISHNHSQTTAKSLSSSLSISCDLWLPQKYTALFFYYVEDVENVHLTGRLNCCLRQRDATVDRFARTVQNFPAMRWLSYLSLLSHNFVTKYRKKVVQTAANDLRMLQAYPAPRVQVPRRILKFIVGNLKQLHMLRHLRDNFGVDYYSRTYFPSAYTPSTPWNKFMVRSSGLGIRCPLLMPCLIQTLQN